LAVDTASKNPTTGLLGAEGESTAPQQAQYGQQFAQYQQQLGDLGPGLQQQADYGAGMLAYQLAGTGINNQQTQLQQQGTEQQYQLTQQAQQEQAQKNQLNFANQMQSLIGGRAASGSLNTGGSTRDQTTLATQEQWANADLSRQEQQTAGDYARAEANYELVGKANGISAAEAKTRFKYGLEQLGEGADPSTLMAQAGNVASGAIQGVGGTIANAYMIGGANGNTLFSDLG
jgi:hypothetical protein